MEGVIPNSKVVILPSANEGEAWKRELFLRPGEWIPWVTVTVVAGMVLLAIIVFVLHLNEKVRVSFVYLIDRIDSRVFGFVYSAKTSWSAEGLHITSTLMLCDWIWKELTERF